jgi:Tfp pilus assembly protein PilN
MTDVNLIPADYTRQKNMQLLVKLFLYCFGALLLLGIAARTALGIAYNHEKSRAEKLQTGELLMQEQKEQHDQLVAKKEDLQTRIKMLENLRGGPPAKQMFIAIDQAINESVWVTKLDFSRAEDDSGNNKKGGTTGYFIIVPEGKQAASPEMAGLESGRINITGMAVTHSALADFVNLLADQPIIKMVQVKNTHSRKYIESSVVEYELTAVMMSDNPTR